MHKRRDTNVPAGEENSHTDGDLEQEVGLKACIRRLPKLAPLRNKAAEAYQVSNL
jgi:hypothetical protein